MESQALRELVKKVFGSEDSRRQFVKDPEGVIARFALTNEEKRAVLSTHARLGLAAAGPQLEAVMTSDPWLAPGVMETSDPWLAPGVMESSDPWLAPTLQQK